VQCKRQQPQNCSQQST